MHTQSIIAGLLLIMMCGSSHAENTKVTMGDGQIAGQQLAEYKHTWKQCSLQEGEWVSGPDLIESADIIGGLLRVSQASSRPDGSGMSTSAYLQHSSLAPLRIEIQQTGADGNIAASMLHKLNDQGYQSLIQQGEKTQTREGEINSDMYLGTGMGLPIALLDPELLPAEISASMLVFDATYRVILTDAGTEIINHNGQAVETRMVDVEWHHLGEGDIYPPGPDASGGRYWVVSNPPEGFPYVPRYKTDTYAVEFVADSCK